MNPLKAAQKLLVAGDAHRSAAKRTAVDRLNVVLGIVAVSMFAALVIAAVSEALEPAPAPYPAETIV